MWASLLRSHCLEYRGFSDDPSSKFYLPEELTQKIYDASTNICDAGVLATVSKSGRQNVRDRMEHVLKLTQPPFNIPKNRLCNITRVHLSYANMNDNHMITFAAALANGALAQVTELYLYNNMIGDAGLTALATACAKGALAKVTRIDLSENQIGDVGLTALADACAKGALPQCEKLLLHMNKIGDAGVAALAKAIAPDENGNGALASLQKLKVDNEKHPALKAACQARGIELW